MKLNVRLFPALLSRLQRMMLGLICLIVVVTTVPMLCLPNNDLANTRSGIMLLPALKPTLLTLKLFSRILPATQTILVPLWIFVRISLRLMPNAHLNVVFR